ncbi:8453_t:CDS:2 [Ambispora leptoticha]|uniref:8453_t:CDS:1 n=1 Tax=Ambispora leptoticha TaxID=144679 RepID=A0A9N8VT23_9GLOM|nr:8453_t:CDS:2 [Ambispora leptoticha]
MGHKNWKAIGNKHGRRNGKQFNKNPLTQEDDQEIIKLYEENGKAQAHDDISTPSSLEVFADFATKWENKMSLKAVLNPKNSQNIELFSNC